jgi:hypothetical protein
MNGITNERTERLVAASLAAAGIAGLAWLVAMVYVIAMWSANG